MSITDSLLIYLKNCIAVIASIPNYFHAKLLGAYLILVYSFFFDVSNVSLMSAIVFLIIFDCITAIFAAVKRSERIESRKMIKSVFKILIYGLLISAMHLVDKVMFISNFSFNLEILAMSFLAATEGVSILENIGKAGYVVPRQVLTILQKFTQKEEPSLPDESTT